MNFEINHNFWKIKIHSSKVLVDEYNSEHEDKAKFVFGITKFPTHEIWLNGSLCHEEQIATLKHELTHVWLWSYGYNNTPEYTEEMICDIVSRIHDFITDVVKDYKDYVITIQKGGTNEF